jgi:hypothetical protein
MPSCTASAMSSHVLVSEECLVPSDVDIALVSGLIVNASLAELSLCLSVSHGDPSKSSRS